METSKRSIGTRTKLSASMADLGSVARINPDNFNSLSFSFILDKVLQLEETPIANPIVHCPASSQLSYPLEVFHHNLVSIKIGNDIFADIVVIPSHKTSFSSSELFEKPLAGTSAFGLQFTTQIFESSLNLLDFTAIIESAVRCDCQIVYAEVNTKNPILESRAFSLNLFSKSKQEETSAFIVNSQQAFPDIPSKIFFIAVRDAEWQFNPAIESRDAQDIVLEGSRTWEVISDRGFIDDWLASCSFNHSASLLDAGNSKLGWQFESLSQSAIDEWMQFDIIPNPAFPSLIDAELQSLAVNFDGSDYLWCSWNSDFGYCLAFHAYIKPDKHINISEGRIPPNLERLGILRRM